MNRLLLIAFLVFATSSARATRLEIGGGKIDVNFSPGASADFEGRVISWVKSAAEAVTKYFGRYPVSRVVVNVDLNEGDRVNSGRTFGNSEGGVITIRVGRATSAARPPTAIAAVHVQGPEKGAGHVASRLGRAPRIVETLTRCRTA